MDAVIYFQGLKANLVMSASQPTPASLLFVT
jgi:hypothetical protein